MNHIQKTIEGFRADFEYSFGDDAYDINKKSAELFIVRSHITYLEELKKEIEGKIRDGSSFSGRDQIDGYNSALNEILSHINSQLEEAKKII
jgi:hypothetical protein